MRSLDKAQTARIIDALCEAYVYHGVIELALWRYTLTHGVMRPNAADFRAFLESEEQVLKGFTQHLHDAMERQHGH